MAEEEKVVAKKEEKKSLTWLWILIAVVIIAGVLVLVFSKDKEEVTPTTTKTEEVSKHPDWSEYTAKKYGFTINHPAEYTVSESAVGNLIFSKAGAEIVDLYVVSASGSDKAAAMKSQEDLFMSETMGLMVGDEAIQIQTAGLSATQVNGVFGKNGGINLSHEGVAGSAIFFIQNEMMFVFDSYDGGDKATRDIFTDMVDTVKF